MDEVDGFAVHIELAGDIGVKCIDPIFISVRRHV